MSDMAATPFLVENRKSIQIYVDNLCTPSHHHIFPPPPPHHSLHHFLHQHTTIHRYKTEHVETLIPLQMPAYIGSGPHTKLDTISNNLARQPRQNTGQRTAHGQSNPDWTTKEQNTSSNHEKPQGNKHGGTNGQHLKQILNYTIQRNWRIPSASYHKTSMDSKWNTTQTD